MNEGPDHIQQQTLAPPGARACLRYRTNRGRSSSVIRKSSSDPRQFSSALPAVATRGELPPGCSGTRAGGGPLKTGSRWSVHAAVAPFLRSLTVSAPAAIARSLHRRRADQNAVRCAAQQKRCWVPPCRARKGCPHHRQAPSLGGSSSRKAGVRGAVIMLFAAATSDSRPPAAPPLERVRPPAGSRRGHTTDSSGCASDAIYAATRRLVIACL